MGVTDQKMKRIVLYGGPLWNTEIPVVEEAKYVYIPFSGEWHVYKVGDGIGYYRDSFPGGRIPPLMSSYEDKKKG